MNTRLTVAYHDGVGGNCPWMNFPSADEAEQFAVRWLDYFPTDIVMLWED